MHSMLVAQLPSGRELLDEFFFLVTLSLQLLILLLLTLHLLFQFLHLMDHV